jgi:hypothetical protein
LASRLQREHQTGYAVAKHVQARDAGRPIGEPAARGRVTDAFLPKIEEWIETSKGRIRADKAHEKLLTLGYTGSEGTAPDFVDSRG